MFLQLTGRLPALKRKGSVTPTRERKPKKPKRVRIKEQRRSKSLESAPNFALAVNSHEIHSENDLISERLNLAKPREEMTTRMGLRSKNRSGDEGPRVTGGSPLIRESASNASGEDNHDPANREDLSARESVNHLTDGSDMD